MIPRINEAITSLGLKSAYSIDNGEIESWDIGSSKTGEEQPTKEELDAELKKLEDEYAAQEYARNRKAEYDALNQFEMQYDDDVNDTTTWKDAIVAIKAKWPKDNSGPK